MKDLKYMTSNSPLARMIQAANNPYHALHVARAFQLQKPHLNPINQVSPVDNVPWVMMKAKKK